MTPTEQFLDWRDRSDEVDKNIQDTNAAYQKGYEDGLRNVPKNNPHPTGSLFELFYNAGYACGGRVLQKWKENNQTQS